MKSISTISCIIISMLIVSCKKDDNPETVNHAPSIPVINSPLDNSTEQSLSILIEWSAAEDIDNDAITYNVYAGTNENSLSIISGNQTGTSYNYNNLNQLTTYFIKVEALDEHNASAESNVIQFTTTKFGSFTDTRDANTYGTVKIGNQIWMTENLRYDVSNLSWDYNNDPTNSNTYGKLYTWSGAASAAPAGWHLPTDEEWKTLEANLGMSATDLDLSGYSTVRGTDQGTQLQAGGSSGMEFHPAGYRSGTSYFALGNRTYLWVNTTISNGDPYRRRLVVNDGSVYRFTNPQAGFAISIRLIKDE